MRQKEDAPEFVVQLVFPRELDDGGHPLAEVVEYEEEFAGGDPRRIAVVFEGDDEVRHGVIAREVPMALAYMALDKIGAVSVSYAGRMHPI